MKRLWKRCCGVLLAAVLLCEATVAKAVAVTPDVAAPPQTSAKAFLVMEAATRTVLFSQNADQPLPMASTTKIMSALLCIESGDLDTPFTVDSDAIRVEGSSMGLTEGDIVTKRALCYGMLLPSGNDAAGAAAVHIDGSYEAFAGRMNERAAEIGMTHTHFVTPSGLHDEQHHSTAYDMALLTAEAMSNDIFRSICGQSRAKVTFGNPPTERWLENSNRLLTMDDTITGVKTGFTDEAGRCLVSACQRDGVTLLCVTLNDRDDWNDHLALYEAAFPLVTAKVPAVPQTLSLPVAGGTAETVQLTTDATFTPPAIGVLRDGSGSDHQKISCRWHVETVPFLFAPVQQGQLAGYLVYECSGHFLCRQPLYAACDVPCLKNQKNKKN